MKKILIVLLLYAGNGFAQVRFNTVLNAPVKNTSLTALKGKVVLIEFWATWCGSCIEAMPHLEALQRQFAKELQVITVTEEAVKRMELYLKKRPSNLWFAVDSGGEIGALYPHQLIPHTILISPEGSLVAETSPEFLTAPVIDSLIRHQAVHLPDKHDQEMSYEDLLKNIFHADDTVKSRMMIQPSIKGAPGVSTNYLGDSAFYGRRITAINLTSPGLYRLAYGSIPFSRIINELPGKANEPAYCLDIIVPEAKDLLPALQKELRARFDYQAKLESQLKEVYVLNIADLEKFKAIPLNTTGKPTYFGRHGEIDRQDMTMTDLADYLEVYGVGRPVFDETGNQGKFNIKFSFQPENPQSLTDILAGMGLSLTRDYRKIDMLVLYEMKP